jgi:Leucine-rich repeat (LRR) protein
MILVSSWNLKTLRLEGIAFSKSVIAALPYCTTLKQLELVNCNLEDKEAVALALALVKNCSCSVETLDLTGNNITDPCCEVISQALRMNNTSIKSLRLGRNETNSQESSIKASKFWKYRATAA